ncbi:MAG: calcium/sodium antiporter [Flammeovirgaceae bacterium]|nr:calcium/sodium antiporter [Flammeovirgaceae bacterium]
MLLNIFLLITGFFVLIKGADFLVSGSSSIAKKMKISDLAIGLTIVAFGTSSPELLVNIMSSLKGYNDAAFGNVIGSNNFNLMLILGVSGIIFPLVVQRNTVKYEIPISLAAIALFIILINDYRIWGTVNELSRTDAIILLVGFLGFLVYVYGMMKRKPEFENESIVKEYKTPIAIGIALFGMIMLIGGGHLVVENAVSIADKYGLSKKLIGLTILAMGTSLPELATSAVAAYRKNTDIAIGNVIGSNIFNLTLVLGVSGVIKPLPYSDELNFDVIIMAVATFCLLIFMFTLSQRKLDRWEAAILLIGYVSYTLYLISAENIKL